MSVQMPPLNALRAFEAAARHLSLTRAAEELHVTPGALSHQIRGLEDFLGVKLFERRVRAIALTPAGKLLYPGLQTGFARIQEAVAGLELASDRRVLVLSTPPGFTAKWLAPRLYRFTDANPDIDIRVSSSFGFANFTTDGIDAAIRNLPSDRTTDPVLVVDKLADLTFMPVCSPRFLERHGPVADAKALARMPLIHDETFARRPEVPAWADWFNLAGVTDVDVNRGLRFNSTDHALDAAGEGAGVLLAHDLPAYGDLRTGRLVIPVRLAMRSSRAYCFVCPKNRAERPHVQAFHTWLKQEVAAVDWKPMGAIRTYDPPA